MIIGCIVKSDGYIVLQVQGCACSFESERSPSLYGNSFTKTPFARFVYLKGAHLPLGIKRRGRREVRARELLEP